MEKAGINHLKGISRSGFHRFLLAVVFLTGMLPACAGGLFSHEGRMTDPGARIPLAKGGPYRGALEKPALVLHYRYAFLQDIQDGKPRRFLNLEGVIIPARSMYYNFSRMDQLSATVHLLDDKGEVLKSQPILTVGFGNRIRPFPFESRIAMPAGTAAMAFSWDGAYGGWGDEEIPYRFRYSPF